MATTTALLLWAIGGLLLQEGVQLSAAGLSLFLASPLLAMAALRLKLAPATPYSVHQRRYVWRFALFYSGVTGGFLALALWLPYYLSVVYQLNLASAALIGLVWLLPAALARMSAARLAQRFGPRRMMYISLTGMLTITFFLSYPPTHYQIHGIRHEIPFTLALSLPLFTILMIALGLFLTLGQAAMLHSLPRYYPTQICTVRATIGLAGSAVASLLLLLFTILSNATAIWQASFMLLFVLALAMLVRMHLAIRRAEHREWANATESADLPELGLGIKNT